jgi:hypothetical protein
MPDFEAKLVHFVVLASGAAQRRKSDPLGEVVGAGTLGLREFEITDRMPGRSSSRNISPPFKRI